MRKATADQAERFKRMELQMNKKGWDLERDPGKVVRMTGTIQSITIDPPNAITLILLDWRVESNEPASEKALEGR
jgi:hypothetical protein